MLAELQMQPEEIAQLARQVHGSGTESDWRPDAGMLNFSNAQNWINQVWSEVEAAFDAIVKEGEAVIEKWVRRVMTEVDRMTDALNEAADDAIVLLKRKLSELQQLICQTAVNLLPQKLTVRGEDVLISEVSVDFAIQVQTGIEASLAWAFKMAASGTLTVSASYAAQR